MKKPVLIILFAIASIFSAEKSYGQLWGLVDAGAFIAKDISGFGPELKAGWHFGDYDINMATLGGGYWMLPQTNQIVIVSDTLGNTDTIESKLKGNIISIDADYRRYLYQTDVDDFFGFYVVGGASLWMVNSVMNVGYYDKGLYAVPSETKLTQQNMSIRLPLGVGIDWTILGKVWWYFDARVEIPITQVNDIYIGNDFGVSYHFVTGARIPLWDKL